MTDTPAAKPNYLVEVTETISYRVVVQADSTEAAEEAATAFIEETDDRDRFFHECLTRDASFLRRTARRPSDDEEGGSSIEQVAREFEAVDYAPDFVSREIVFPKRPEVNE